VRVAAPAAPIKVIPAPALIQASPDGKTFYVMGGPMLQPLALPGLEPGPPVKIDRIGETRSASSTPTASECTSSAAARTSPRRIWPGAEIADVKTGRTSRKLWLGVQSVVEAERSRAEQQAIDNGQSSYTYSIYTVRLAEGSMVLREDGKALYALNSMTDDVIVVSAETGQLIGKVTVGGFDLRVLSGAPVALAVSSSKLQLIDLAAHVKQADLLEDPSAGFEAVHLAPDGRMAVIQGSGQCTWPESTAVSSWAQARSSPRWWTSRWTGAAAEAAKSLAFAARLSSSA
jgi:hypothetical protein